MSLGAAVNRKQIPDDSSARQSPQKRGTTKRITRIQQKNRKAILEAALEVFSEYGFRGATVDRIAERAGLSKPNLLYYYSSKLAIYVAVLEDTLAEWLQPLRELDPTGDPVEEIGRYIDAKLEMSRTRPEASRLFANEILHGAPAIGDFLRGPMKVLIDEKAETMRRWMHEGRLAHVDPYHLIMMIWAVTQHYADFDVQVRTVLGNGRGSHPARLAGPEIAKLFFEGLKPRLFPQSESPSGS